MRRQIYARLLLNVHVRDCVLPKHRIMMICGLLVDDIRGTLLKACTCIREAASVVVLVTGTSKGQVSAHENVTSMNWVKYLGF